jgi:hypothetical protein
VLPQVWNEDTERIMHVTASKFISVNKLEQCEIDRYITIVANKKELDRQFGGDSVEPPTSPAAEVTPKKPPSSQHASLPSTRILRERHVERSSGRAWSKRQRLPLSDDVEDHLAADAAAAKAREVDDDMFLRQLEAEASAVKAYAAKAAAAEAAAAPDEDAEAAAAEAEAAKAAAAEDEAAEAEAAEAEAASARAREEEEANATQVESGEESDEDEQQQAIAVVAVLAALLLLLPLLFQAIHCTYCTGIRCTALPGVWHRESHRHFFIKKCAPPLHSRPLCTRVPYAPLHLRPPLSHHLSICL